MVETFPFSRILRWVAADTRSGNKGEANQLDLQINIPGVGKKDLRIQFANEAVVKETLGEIDGTVKELMEQRRKQMTPKDKVKNVAKAATTAKQVAAPSTKPPPPSAPTPPPAATPPEKKPKKSVLGRMMSLGRSSSSSTALPKEFNVEVVNPNMKRTMPLKIKVSAEGVQFLKPTGGNMENFKFGHSLVACKNSLKEPDLFVLTVAKPGSKSTKDLNLKAKQKNETDKIISLISSLAQQNPHPLAGPAPEELDEVAPEEATAPEAPTAPSAPSAPTAPEPAPEPAAPKPSSPPPLPAVPPAPEPPAAPEPPVPTAPPAAPSAPGMPPMPEIPDPPTAPEGPSPSTAPPPAAAPEPPALPTKLSPRTERAMSHIEMERRATATGEDISKLRRPTAAHIDPPPPASLEESAHEPSPTPATDSDATELRKALQKAEEENAMLKLQLEKMRLASGGNEGIVSDLEKQKEFSKRMREALMARDKRLIELEQLVMDQTGLRIRAEEDRMELLGKLRDSQEQIVQLQKSQTFQQALNAGVVPRELVAKNPDLLQREGLRQARHEVMHLEKEREELSFINGRLLLRLNEMEGSISRLRQSLKVQTAAEKLNSAYEAAKDAQKVATDTALMLLPGPTPFPAS